MDSSKIAWIIDYFFHDYFYILILKYIYTIKMIKPFKVEISDKYLQNIYSKGEKLPMA